MLCLSSCSTTCGFQLGSQQFSDADVVVSGVCGLGCFFNLQIQEVSWKILGWERDSGQFTGNLCRAVPELQMKSELCWASSFDECSSLFVILREETCTAVSPQSWCSKTSPRAQKSTSASADVFKPQTRNGNLCAHWETKSKLSQKPHDGWLHPVYTHLPSCLSAAASHLYLLKWIG